MKKTLIVLLAAVLLCFVFTACGCEHQYEEKTTKEASCSETGVKTFTCTSCGDSYTEEISTIDHTFGAPTVTKEATCQTKGEETSTCSVCGETKLSETELGEHKYGEWIVTKKATSTSIGEERSSCTICNEKIYRDIPMLEPTSITLNKENFLDYFSVDTAVTNFEKEKGSIFTHNNATVKVTCSLKVDGEINNVSVELVLLPAGTLWDGKRYDPITLSIPSRTGVTEATQILYIASTGTSVVKPTKVNFEITDVSGTILIYE